jgi:AcrR family transcriptional regulator
MPRAKDPALRDRLVEAATEAFAELGYAATTMVEVGQRAGVTKGGVYFHFAGKEDLFFAVLDAWQARLRARFEGAIEPRGVVVDSPTAGGSSAAERLVDALATWLGFHFEHPSGARVLRVLPDEMRGRWTARLRQDQRADLRARRAAIRGVFVQGTAEGCLFAPDPAFAAFVIVSSMDGAIDHWLRAPDDTAPYCSARPLAEQIVAPWIQTAPDSEAEVGDELEQDPARPGWQPFV